LGFGTVKTVIASRGCDGEKIKQRSKNRRKYRHIKHLNKKEV